MIRGFSFPHHFQPLLHQIQSEWIFKALSTMKKTFLFLLLNVTCQYYAGLFAQNIGIGTTTPTENLHVVGNKALFQTNFVGIGVGNPVTPYTVFQVKKNFNDYVGMYVDAGSAGKPFYGYSMGGVSKAYTCFDGANNQFEYYQSF